MIHELWCATETFLGALHHIQEMVSKNLMDHEIRSFSVFPVFDEDTNEIVSYQAVLYYMRVRHSAITIEEELNRR